MTLPSAARPSKWSWPGCSLTQARNRLAGRCSTKASPKERIGTFTIYEPVGCEHCNDLRTAGLLKTMQGITSLEEINRVTKD